MLDIFAWIVLLILLASGLAMFFIAGSLPGAHRQKPRPSLGAGRHRRRLGDVDLWLCLMASHNHLGLCGFPGPS